MKAMVLEAVTKLPENRKPLRLREADEPVPGVGEVLVRVRACGVCHTELDEIEGRVETARLPMILGHQVVGGHGVHAGGAALPDVGRRVGVGWIGGACGRCEYCRGGRENLCADFRATGRDLEGGYAELMRVRADFVHEIPDGLGDLEAAPMLCAGAIGFRALRLSGVRDGEALGLMGFGGSNHLVLKLARQMFPAGRVYVMTRRREEQEFALALGASWAGGLEDVPPEELDSVIDTTPVWRAVSEGLKKIKPGGRLVINAIRKEEGDRGVLAGLDYAGQIWMEKEIKSVANVTREDVRAFLKMAAEAGIRAETEEYGLEDANQALLEMKEGKIHGAKVLRIG